VTRFWLLAVAIVAFAGRAWAQPARPPNLLFILADDLGWTDAGFAGSRFYETPNLDRLATNGLRLTSFYASQNCAPTRASLLSGQYAPRTGVFTVGSLERGDDAARRMDTPDNTAHLPPGAPSLASVLKSAGYATGFFGKWQLGNDGDHHPLKHGFDEAVLAADKHFGFSTDPEMEVPADVYLADFLTDRAVDFMGRHKDRPFYLHLAHLAVHSPYEAKPDLIARFAKKPPAAGHRDATYAAMIASLDESVGRLMAHLEELGIANQTLVIFTSDNGGVGGYVDPDNPSRRTGVTDNAPLRGGKGMLYEGGLRVPFLVRWPGVTPPGSRSSQPCVHVDIFPTFCEIAGVRLPANHQIDGVSLVALFRDPNAHLGRDAIYWHFPGYLEAYGRPGWRTTPAGAVRAGNFKLIEFFEDNRLELYNLVEDVGEKNNLVRSLPDKAAELRQKLEAWRVAIGAPMPTLKGRSADAPAETPRP
jgi:arylsulfatase A-like enzyme